MGSVIRRSFVIGDLVTIAPDFRNTVLDFDFERYIGIVIKTPKANEYVVYWTNSPINNYYKGMWSGDHLIKVEDYSGAKEKVKKNGLNYVEI